MRMFPPAPILSRYCSEDTTIGEGITVEKVCSSKIVIVLIEFVQGASVMWFNTYFHMHPDLYDNPTGSFRIWFPLMMINMAYKLYAAYHWHIIVNSDFRIEILKTSPKM